MSDNNTTGSDRAINSSGAGRLAEEEAARFLEKRGLTVLRRNFRCRGGEIDLVCRDRKVLVFVEVRLRRRADFGGASASITANKQRRIVLAARHYLAAHTGGDGDCRFDCVLLDGKTIEWVSDAFPSD